MGTDITIYTEKKLDNKWICCDHFSFSNRYNLGKQTLVPIYDKRDYRLFTALCGVRESFGIVPISEPKGLPDDLSEKVKNLIADEEVFMYHSCSYLTAKELFKYQNENPFTTFRGLITGEDLKRFDEYGTYPESWCQGASGPGYEWRTWKMPGSPVDELVTAVKKRMREEFDFDYAFYSEEEKLIKYLKYSEDFRIVFGFDC